MTVTVNDWPSVSMWALPRPVGAIDCKLICTHKLEQTTYEIARNLRRKWRETTCILINKLHVDRQPFELMSLILNEILSSFQHEFQGRTWILQLAQFEGKRTASIRIAKDEVVAVHGRMTSNHINTEEQVSLSAYEIPVRGVRAHFHLVFSRTHPTYHSGFSRFRHLPSVNFFSDQTFPCLRLKDRVSQFHSSYFRVHIVVGRLRHCTKEVVVNEHVVILKAGDLFPPICHLDRAYGLQGINTLIDLKTFLFSQQQNTPMSLPTTVWEKRQLWGYGIWTDIELSGEMWETAAETHQVIRQFQRRTGQDHFPLQQQQALRVLTALPFDPSWRYTLLSFE